MKYNINQGKFSRNALSKIEFAEVMLQSITVVTIELWAQIKDSWEKDQNLQDIIYSLQHGHQYSHYTWS